MTGRQGNKTARQTARQQDSKDETSEALSVEEFLLFHFLRFSFFFFLLRLLFFGLFSDLLIFVLQGWLHRSEPHDIYGVCVALSTKLKKEKKEGTCHLHSLPASIVRRTAKGLKIQLLHLI